MPAEPQHSSGSAISRSSRPGMPSSSRARLGPDALGVRQVAGVVVGDGQLERVPRRRPGRARRGSPRRRATFSANARARSAYAGSSASSSAYSFIVEPQPAALTTTRSTPVASKVSTSVRAKPCASSSRPLCTDSAPQQPCCRGHDHVAALGLQHPGGGGVDAGEERALHAAGEQADHRAALAGRRDALGQLLGLAQPGGEALHRGQLRRDPLQQAGAPHRAGRGRSVW